MNQLVNKTALVTGAASGIGAAICALFRQEGAMVIGMDLRPATEVDVSLITDVSCDESVDKSFAQIRETSEMPDIVVHAAAISEHGGVLKTSSEVYAKIYSVNVLGAVRVMRHCLPDMCERRAGSVVLVSSINADFATPTQAAYAASKAALNSIMKTAALEYGPNGIRVNSIAPASIDTPLLRSGFGSSPEADAAMELNKRRHPISRWGTAVEVAELALFLASDRSTWITGAVHRIDGGASVTRR